MDRVAFNSCISQGMKGKKFTKEQRKLEFCITAKRCARGIDRTQAESICSQPKPPKPEGVGKRRTKKAECPVCDSTMFISQCEKKLPGLIRSGELPANTDIPGLCQLILG